MNLTDINEIRALLDRLNFRFSKSMGQNFLCAAWVPERIADSCGADSETGVLEVGPGIGCLTVKLAERAKKVVSVELDRSLQPVLAETLKGCDNVQVVFGDILKTDLNQLVSYYLSDCKKIIVCANLPYNITTPVLTEFVESGCFENITVMLQKEVAQRICARENTPDYGSFTVLMQWYCQAEKLFDVSPNCFIPAPKVTSSVIKLDFRKQAAASVKDEKLMFSIVRAAFNQRRKTLSNALANGLGGRYTKEQIFMAINGCGFDERIRGEALSIADFARLSDALLKISD